MQLQLEDVGDITGAVAIRAGEHEGDVMVKNRAPPQGPARIQGAGVIQAREHEQDAKSEKQGNTPGEGMEGRQGKAQPWGNTQ